MSDYIDSMVEGFVECWLWAGLDWENTTDHGGTEDNPVPLDENYDSEDIAPDALTEVRHDCEAFYETHACILDWLYRFGLPGEKIQIYTAEQAGHDFYLTREGHGTGFWDRGLGVLGDILTAGAKSYGAVEHYIDEGGQICLN